MIDRATLRKAWALLDGRERRAAWITLAAVIVGALSSALMVGSILPFLSVLSDPGRIHAVPALSWAYETLGFASDFAFLIALGAASFAVILLTSLMQIVKTYVVARFAMMRMHTISHRLLQTYLRQPYAFFLDRHSGEMGTRILAESQQVVTRFFKPAAEAVAAALTIVAIVALLILVEPVVSLVAFGVLGGLYGRVFLATRRRLKRHGAARVAANTQRYRIAGEALGGIKDIKLLGREAGYLDRYATPSRRMARADVWIQVLSGVPQFALQAVAFGGIILLCLVLLDAEGLASGAALGTLLPVLGVFAFAGQRLMPELGRLYRSLAQIQAGRAALDAVYRDVKALEVAVPLPAAPPDRLPFSRSLRLEGVGYRYPNADRPGLDAIDLEIRAGEKIGVVGSTGAGKTTLADVVLGLLEPGQGRIVVDDTAVDAANLRAWQQNVGYVPQEIFLVDASVRENIAFAIPPGAIDDARVVHAARIARIDRFITEELPRGYDTAVGERGVRLSGGQRQRIGIARAMYHDAAFVVFDEATSALDNLTEAEVMAAIDALPGDKTVLMIAHRLSTVRQCDRILLLDRGRVAGLGRWEDLEATNPAFRAMVARMEAA